VEYQGEGIGILDCGYRFLFANPAGEEIFGVEQDRLVGRSMEEFITPASMQVFAQETSRRDRGVQTSYEITIQRPDLERCDVLVTANPWFDPAGAFIGWFVVFRDISERKQVEERLEYLSMHDVLTGLYNRAYFEEKITSLELEKAYPVSVVMGDMDRLKAINDSLGHAAGDELLRQTANLLRSAFREDDVVARLGGDEFAVILPGTDQATAERALLRLRRKLAQYNKTAEVLKVQLSMGVATAVEGMRVAEAMDLADKRMYADKTRRASSGLIPDHT
jgi:diguanylate cyclase (GGDEF)-like protein/PAS domain S-box-containing protein